MLVTESQWCLANVRDIRTLVNKLSEVHTPLFNFGVLQRFDTSALFPVENGLYLKVGADIKLNNRCHIRYTVSLQLMKMLIAITST